MKQSIQKGFTLLSQKTYSLVIELNLLEHLLNKKHSLGHRMFFGLIIGYVGVVIAKSAEELGHFAQIGDGIGYFLHGLGITPYIDRLSDTYNKKD